MLEVRHLTTLLAIEEAGSLMEAAEQETLLHYCENKWVNQDWWL